MEKTEMVRSLMRSGINRDTSLQIAGLSKNQFYYQPKGGIRGRSKTTTTKWKNSQTSEIKYVNNEDVIKLIVQYKLDPDHANWYKLICYNLQLNGFYINHKKVYRLMYQHLLLEDAPKKATRNFVKYRKVSPIRPLQIIEMDIKYVYIEGQNKHAFVLTILDTFTRDVLFWTAGYSMKSEQIKQSWEYIIAEYFQPRKIDLKNIIVEVRNDNGRQFLADLIRNFFEENNIKQIFTKPYTPEENGHIESFHSILSEAIKSDVFLTLNELEDRLVKFYYCYKHFRSHSGTKGIPPSIFWMLFELNYIEVISLKNNQYKIKLKVAYQDILSLPEISKLISGNTVTGRKTFAFE